MKAILIDSKNRTVTEVNTEATLNDLYKALNCSTVTTQRMPNGDVMYLDDEGLLGRPNDFMYHDDLGLFAGNGLIVGDDGEGGSTDAKSTAKDIIDRLEFMDSEKVRGLFDLGELY